MLRHVSHFNQKGETWLTTQEQKMPDGKHLKTKDGIPTRQELKLEVIDALVEALHHKMCHGRVAYFNHDIIEKTSKLAGNGGHAKMVKLVGERIY
jgi:hypothetical protein